MLTTASMPVRLGATFIARVLGGIGGSLLAFMIARHSGPTVLGQFTMFVSILGIAGILAQRGLNMVLIRAVAEERSHTSDGDTTTLFFTAVRMCVFPAAALSLVGALLLSGHLFGATIKGAPASFVIALPMLTLLALVSAYLKGVGKPWISPLFEIGGISGIAGLVLLMLIAFEPTASGSQAIAAFLAGQVIICGLAWLALHREFSRRSLRDAAVSIDPRAEKRWSGQYDFMIIALSAFMLQAGSFAIAGGLLSSQNLGLLRAAERLAVIISFPILAINPFIASEIVKFRISSDLNALRRTVRRAMAAGVALSIGPFLVFVLFPSACLNWIGPNFTAATPYLRLMALANFVIVLCGPAAMVVNMSRIERRGMIANASFLILGLIIFPLLTIIMGASGFVLAYCIVGIGRAVAVYYLARQGLSGFFDHTAYLSVMSVHIKYFSAQAIIDAAPESLNVMLGHKAMTLTNPTAKSRTSANDETYHFGVNGLCALNQPLK